MFDVNHHDAIQVDDAEYDGWTELQVEVCSITSSDTSAGLGWPAERAGHSVTGHALAHL
jgi:hypothetical protein